MPPNPRIPPPPAPRAHLDLSTLRAQIEQGGLDGLLAREALHDRAVRARRAARLRRWAARACGALLAAGLVMLVGARAMALAFAPVEACPLPHAGGWVDVSGPSDVPPLPHAAGCRSVGGGRPE